MGTVPHMTKGHRWLGGSHTNMPAGPPHSPSGTARRHPPLARLGRGLDGVNGEQHRGETQHPHPDSPSTCRILSPPLEDPSLEPSQQHMHIPGPTSNTDVGHRPRGHVGPLRLWPHTPHSLTPPQSPPHRHALPQTPKSSNHQTFHATSYPSAGFTEIEI